MWFLPKNSHLWRKARPDHTARKGFLVELNIRTLTHHINSREQAMLVGRQLHSHPST